MAAKLDVTIDPSGAKSGAQQAVQAANSVKTSFNDLKGALGYLKEDLARVGGQFKDLGKNASANDLKRLKDDLSMVRDGLKSTQQELTNFGKASTATATKEMKKELQSMSKELDATGKGIGSLDKNLDSAISKATKNIQNSSRGMSTAASNLTATLRRLVAGYLSFRALRGIFNDIISATVKHEQAEVRLSSVIKATGNAAGVSVEQIKALASELQDVTTYSSTAILEMQGVLSTFRNIKGDTFKDATKVILDFSTVFGTGLTSAARTVGRALDQPLKGLTALQRIGIRFTDDQKKMIDSLIKTGDVAGAQAVIMKELQGKVGDVSKAMRNTLGGAIESLRNTWSTLLAMDKRDSFGNLKTAIEDLNDDLKSDAILRFKDRLGDLIANGLNRFASGLKIIAENFDTALGAFKAFIAYMSSRSVLAAFGVGGPVSLALALGGAKAVYDSNAREAEQAAIDTLANQQRLDLYQGEAVRLQNLMAEQQKKGADATDISAIKADLNDVYDEIERLRKALGMPITTEIEIKIDDYNVDAGNSKTKGKSAIQKMVDDIRYQIQYAEKDGMEFLSVVEKLISKAETLKDKVAAGKLQQEIFKSEMSRIQNEVAFKGGTGEEYLPWLYEMQKRFKELTPMWIEFEQAIRSVGDRKWAEVTWDLSQGLITSKDYTEQLETEISKLVEGTESWKTKIQELQGLKLDQASQEVALLNKQIEYGRISADAYKAAIDGLAEKYGQTPKIEQLVIDSNIDLLNDQFYSRKITLQEYQSALTDIIDLYADKFPSSVQKAVDAMMGLNTTQKQLSDALEQSTKDFIDLEGKGILGAVDGFMRAAVYGDNFGEALKKLGQDIIFTTLRMIILEQLTKSLGFAFGGAGGGSVSAAWGANFTPSWGFAKGGVINQGYHLKKYASGGIVDRPTIFPMRSGMGLMGEVPGKSEGIFPLTRMPNGDLGVQASGASQSQQAPTLVVNIENRTSTPISSQQTQPKWDEQLKKFVIGIILDDQASNGPITRNYKPTR